jgi:branched-chain amino acid transport system permease protein
VVNINPWLQEMAYGALSILAVTLFPEGVVGVVKRRVMARRASAEGALPADAYVEAGPLEQGEGKALSRDPIEADEAASEFIVECRGVEFSYGAGLKVLRNVDFAVRRGHIHGLIGPNGSGKSTLANIIAGRIHPIAGEVRVKGVRVDGLPPGRRAKLGMRRTFQAAELVRELSTSDNVSVGLFDRVPGIAQRAAFWTLLPSALRDSASIQQRARGALEQVGASEWTARAVSDVPHGVEQLTQLASVCVAGPDIIVLDEPATGL